MNLFSWKYVAHTVLGSAAVLGLSGCWSREPLPSDQSGALINEPAGVRYDSSYQASAPMQGSTSQWEPGYTQSWRGPVMNESAGAQVETSTVQVQPQPSTTTAPQMSGQSSGRWVPGLRPTETAQPAASEQNGWQRGIGYSTRQSITESSGAQNGNGQVNQNWQQQNPGATTTQQSDQIQSQQNNRDQQLQQQNDQLQQENQQLRQDNLQLRHQNQRLEQQSQSQPPQQNQLRPQQPGEQQTPSGSSTTP
jgi:hypothetical protein